MSEPKKPGPWPLITQDGRVVGPSELAPPPKPKARCAVCGDTRYEHWLIRLQHDPGWSYHEFKPPLKL